MADYYEDKDEYEEEDEEGYEYEEGIEYDDDEEGYEYEEGYEEGVEYDDDDEEDGNIMDYYGSDEEDEDSQSEDEDDRDSQKYTPSYADTQRTSETGEIVGGVIGQISTMLIKTPEDKVKEKTSEEIGKMDISDDIRKNEINKINSIKRIADLKPK